MATMKMKFVDLPVAVPATLFDLNSGTDTDIAMDKDFHLDPPTLRRISAVNQVTNGSIPTADAYDNRFLVFTVGLHAPTKALRVLQMDALIDELSKPTNLIMYQLDSTQPPVFFRTFRCDDYKLDDGGNGNAEVWYVTLNIEAEPFAIGLRRDIATITVKADPAAASGNKTLFDITGIVGDAPTMAFVKIATLGANNVMWLATRSMNNPTSLTPFFQAETATLGTDTTAAADVSGSSVVPGTGNSRSVTTFANNNLIARLTVNAPSGSDPIAFRGRYRVICRISASAAQNVTMRWRQVPSGDSVPGPQTSVDVALAWQFIDLGIIEFPAPQVSPAVIGYSGLQPGHAATPLSIEARRNSGTGSLWIDYIYLLPADESQCALYQLMDVTSGWIVADGPNDATYGLANGSTPFGATRNLDNAQGIVTRQGGLPMLVPGVTNRWYTLFAPGNLNASKTFDISYWPRWRKVATS